MKKFSAAVWLAMMAATAQADEQADSSSLYLQATYGACEISGFGGKGSQELSGFKISSGLMSKDADGRVYGNLDYGIRMNSINTPQVPSFKLYSLAFEGSLGLAMLDRKLHDEGAQWSRWLDNIVLTVGIGLPFYATEKVLPNTASYEPTYSYRYGVRYYFTPNVDISFTTEQFTGLLIGNILTGATTRGVDVEVSF